MFVCWGIEGQDCLASKITGYMMCSVVIHDVFAVCFTIGFISYKNSHAIESTHQRKPTGEANIVVVHVKH